MDENERLKELRKSERLTQEQFGKRLGLAKSTISEIEKGYRNLTQQTRLSICREFGVREEWLRDGVGDMYQELSRDAQLETELRNFFSGENDTFKECLIRLLLRLPPEHWDLLAEYAQQLVAENDHADTPEERARKRADDFYEEALAEEQAAVESSASPPTAAKEV